MLQERRPLGNLDTNIHKPFELQRVQPTRAAKTSHKWLSQRKEEKICRGKQVDVLGFGRLHYDDKDKENVGQYSKPTNLMSWTAKSRSEQMSCKDSVHPHRIPLQALSVPTMKPFIPRHPYIDRAQPVTGYEKSFFPPLSQTTEESENSMSISMDTISDSSLLDCENESSQYTGNDSAFFSHTQSSAPFADSEENAIENEKLSFDETRIVSRRSGVGLDHNIDVVDEYLPEILTYMREAEMRYRPKPNCMKQQPEISSNMRTKLVDWLIEVQDEYKLENETVALAVAYSDRFISNMSVTRSKLQLLGTTAMFVAAKYEEIYPPDADEFAYVTADSYTKAEVILMERLLLRVLDNTMSIPTPHQFLGMLLHHSSATSQFRALVNYLTEITMLYDRYHRYSYSVLAASAISVSSYLIQRYATYLNNKVEKNAEDHDKSTKDFLRNHKSRCELSSIVQAYMEDFHDEIYACCLELLLSHRNISAEPQQFVREKYSSKKNYKVALIPSLCGECEGVNSSEEAPIIFSREAFLSIWIEQ